MAEPRRSAVQDNWRKMKGAEHVSAPSDGDNPSIPLNEFNITGSIYRSILVPAMALVAKRDLAKSLAHFQRTGAAGEAPL